MLSTILARFKPTSQPPIWHSSAEVVRGDSPIAVDEEINDNGMLLESLIVEFSELAGLNPYSLETYRLLTIARTTSSSRHIREAIYGTDDAAVLYEAADACRVIEWFDAQHLPKNFRREFIDLIIRFDELEEHVSFLSQSRWEKLRTWSCGNV